MEYLATKEQKELLEQYYKTNTLKLEKRKSEIYNSNNIFDKSQTDKHVQEPIKESLNTDEIEKSELTITRKKPWYKKLFAWLKIK